MDFSQLSTLPPCYEISVHLAFEFALLSWQLQEAAQPWTLPHCVWAHGLAELRRQARGTVEVHQGQAMGISVKTSLLMSVGKPWSPMPGKHPGCTVWYAARADTSAQGFYSGQRCRETNQAKHQSPPSYQRAGTHAWRTNDKHKRRPKVLLAEVGRNTAEVRGWLVCASQPVTEAPYGPLLPRTSSPLWKDRVPG